MGLVSSKQTFFQDSKGHCHFYCEKCPLLLSCYLNTATRTNQGMTVSTLKFVVILTKTVSLNNSIQASWSSFLKETRPYIYPNPPCPAAGLPCIA